MQSARSRTVPVFLTGAVLGALPAIYVVDPNRTRLALCPFHAATGLWCPFCGATRATHALLHGDLSTALHDNALYVVAIPLLLVLWWRWLHTYGAPGSRLLTPGTARLAIAVVAVFGILRNLPVGSFLAPPG
jgi:hypothetical protein